MVAGELAQGFETLANGILTFVNYGITILVIMFIIEVVKLFRGIGIGDKLKEPFSRTAKDYQKGGLKGVGRGLSRDAKKVWSGEQKAEEAEMQKYVALKNLKKAVEKLEGVKSKEELNTVLGEIRSDERVVRRDERRAFRRVKELKKLVNKASLPADKKAEADKIVNEMDVLNNLVLENMKAFDNKVNTFQVNMVKNYGGARNLLLKLLNEVITNERALFAEFKKLNKLLGQ